MKLNHRLIIWIFLIGIIPFLIVGFISLYNTINFEENIKSKIITDKLINIQSEITLWLESMNNHVELISNDKILNSLIVNEINGINETTINQNSTFNNKQYIINYFNNIIKSTMNKRTGKSISEFILLNSDGNTVLSTNSDNYPIGSTFKDSTFFRYYKTEEKEQSITIPGIFGPLYGNDTRKNTDETTFALTSKILDDDGNFVGIVVAFTYPKKLNDIVKYIIASDPNILPYSIYFFDKKERALTYPIVHESKKVYPESYIKSKIRTKNNEHVILSVTDAINTTNKSNKVKVLENPYQGIQSKEVNGGWFWIDMITTEFGGIVELPVNFTKSFLPINVLYFIMILAMIILIILILSFIISKVFINPISNLSKRVSLIANGQITNFNNISKRESDFGHIGISINRLNDILKNVLWNTKNNTQKLIEKSYEIKNENNNLLNNIEDTKNVCKSSSDDLNEIFQMIKENAENADDLNEKARKAINTANEGQHIVNKTMDSINNIDTFSKKISEIISVMDNIAFQTNLLSLNAAVESARSGEHGKGFSVLSAEIRSLAQRSKKAAKQISELIHTTGEKIEETVKLGNSSAKIFYQLLNDMNNVNALIGEFTNRNKSQKSGMDSIFHSIEDMENSLTNNIKMTEKIKNKNDYVINISEEILRLVKFFNISEEINNELQIKPKNEEIEEDFIYKSKDNSKKWKKSKKQKKQKEKTNNYDEDTQLLVEKPDDDNKENEEEYIEEEFILDDNIIEDIIQPIDNESDKK